MTPFPAAVLRGAIARFLLSALFCFGSAAAEAQAPAAPRWIPGKFDNGGATLDYTATVTLLGKPVRINLAFICDPTSKGDVQGTLGFDLFLHGVAVLKPFSFDDFEGPDAVAGAKGRKPMELIVKRKDKAPLVLKVVPNGFAPHAANYAFGIAAPSKEPRSDARTLLRALEADDAESLQIIITDTRQPALKLDLTVPVAGRQAEFKRLLAGLK